jgi:hypothetical protein
MIKAAEMRSLSANGSRNLPKADSRPCRRAYRPSSTSVIDAAEKTTAARNAYNLSEDRSSRTSTEMLAILYRVNWLGKFQSLADKDLCTSVVFWAA